MTSLVDKSLLLVLERTDGQPDFRMLETVRKFTNERLIAEREVDRTLKLSA